MELFDAIVGTGESNSRMTKADVLRGVMGLLGAAPENTVLIGDTKYDVLGARSCGVDCIGVGWGYAAEGELEAAGAAQIVPDQAAMRELFLAP